MSFLLSYLYEARSEPDSKPKNQTQLVLNFSRLVRAGFRSTRSSEFKTGMSPVPFEFSTRMVLYPWGQGTA